jgi:hypothetical protein
MKTLQHTKPASVLPDEGKRSGRIVAQRSFFNDPLWTIIGPLSHSLTTTLDVSPSDNVYLHRKVIGFRYWVFSQLHDALLGASNIGRVALDAVVETGMAPTVDVDVFLGVGKTGLGVGVRVKVEVGVDVGVKVDVEVGVGTAVEVDVECNIGVATETDL